MATRAFARLNSDTSLRGAFPIARSMMVHEQTTINTLEPSLSCKFHECLVTGVTGRHFIATPKIAHLTSFAVLHGLGSWAFALVPLVA